MGLVFDYPISVSNHMHWFSRVENKAIQALSAHLCTLQMTIEKEVIDGTLPFIREKPRDIALVSVHSSDNMQTEE